VELVVPNQDKSAKVLSLELTTLSGLRRIGGKPGTLKLCDNPLTGPFYIEGAAAGDTLVVHCRRSIKY